jgi:PPOX class probable FMN-dependent enzyme
MASISELRGRFREVVSTDEELRAVVGEPPSHSVAKVVTAIDRVARTFIEHAPFAFVASVGEAGRLDVSPRGDPAGFVKVLDEHTLAVPDRLGNRRLDTFHNVLRNPNVGIIFLIPGVTHTLRVSGKAVIVRDEFLRDTMKVNGKAPDHVLVVGVERSSATAFFTDLTPAPCHSTT